MQLGGKKSGLLFPVRVFKKHYASNKNLKHIERPDRCLDEIVVFAKQIKEGNMPVLRLKK